MSGDRTVSRRTLLALALAYFVFVVYGSLVPLDFRAVPFDVAIARFQQIPYLSLGIGSRADWVANILLFIPLTFLWLGVLWHRHNTVWRVIASSIVLIAALVLSVGIEFTQLFFPPRTVSQNDILAESIGAVIGVLAWWLMGARLLQWLAARRQQAGHDVMDRRSLYIYLAVLYAYNLLPLDLTISPVEVFHKLREGRLVLIPFGALPSDPVQAIYDVLSDIAIWLPAGFLWHRTTGSMGKTIRNTLLAAVLLEFLQLWVYSRVSDVTDIFTATVGAWLGTWSAARWMQNQGSDSSHQASSTGGVFIPVIALLLMLAALAGIFWYPFDFNTDGQFLRERLILLKRVPFTAYYYGTEFRAVTEVLHKVLFFAPLGLLSGWVMVRLRWPRVLIWIMGSVFVAGVAAIIEAGQLALQSKNADLTDWALEAIGALFGLWLVTKLLRKSGVAGRHHRHRRHA